MNETSNLFDIKKTFNNTLNFIDNPLQYKIEMKKFIGSTKKLLKELTSEALLTPAGERWFWGQLKIHKSIKYIYNGFIENGSMEFFEEKDPVFCKNLCENIITDLEFIIKSGKGRYITG